MALPRAAVAYCWQLEIINGKFLKFSDRNPKNGQTRTFQILKRTKSLTLITLRGWGWKLAQEATTALEVSIYHF